ncbi:MAG: DUF309 domain-containing protein [Desulfobacteraceae bacterium]|jgi:hypothetical protein|nr:DUF309 domain-containing protein [Desulfobacteraceae bacterium]
MERLSAFPPDEKRPTGKFDPFNNRLSRDIRNSLAEAFMEALSGGEPSFYREEADIWRGKNLSKVYLDYIQDRLQRYDRVFDQIKANGLEDPFLQSLVIWNNGLFFEFHDHLEGMWNQATGDERQALKGLIKAAGVYIHNEYNHQQAVESLSVKSYNLIRQYSRCLAFIVNLDSLLQRLKTLDSDPPRLENPALLED